MTLLSGEISSLFLELLSLTGAASLPLSALYYVRSQKFAKLEKNATIRLEEVIKNLGEGFYRSSLDGRQLSANPALVAMNGYQTEAEMLANVGDISKEWYVEPQRRAEFAQALARDGKVTNFVSEIYRHKTRERIWISENARLARDPLTGNPSHYEGTVNETTEIMDRVHGEERLKKLTSHVPGGLFQLVRYARGTFDVVFSSSGFREMLDYRRNHDGFDIEHFISLIHPVDLPGYYESLKESRKTGRMWTHEFRVVTDGGKSKWLKVQATPERKPDQSVIWHGYLQDVSVSKADEAQIRQLAYNDPLTKLPNRRFIVDRIHQTIAACERRREHGAVLFVDLDNFKQLNDVHGHDIGDLLLIEISKRLKQVVRRNDTVSRLGGDEFVVLLEGLSADKAIADQKIAGVASKILDAFSRPFELGTLKYTSTASIGAVAFDGMVKSVDAVLRLADTAMYQVKKSGRNAFKVFEEGDEKTNANRAQLTGDLVGIARRNELELRLQPQMNEQAQICGAEALIRWNHPKLGLLTPDQFFALAEQAGHMGEINHWVIESAVAQLKSWQGNPITHNINLSVNLSQQQLAHPEFASELRALLRSSAVKPSMLTLEMTEQILLKNRETAVSTLEKLKSTGVRLSLDDFGVAGSSLAQLKDLPIDEIKIDGSFIKVLQNKPRDRAIVKSILAMAKALGLAVVAEHVETQAQENTLLDMSCGIFQGYLYGGPMTGEDFEAACAQSYDRSVGFDRSKRVA